MLDSWIIEEIRRRERVKQPEQPQLPAPPPPEPKKRDEKKSDRGVVIMDLQGDAYELARRSNLGTAHRGPGEFDECPGRTAFVICRA